MPVNSTMSRACQQNFLALPSTDNSNRTPTCKTICSFCTYRAEAFRVSRCSPDGVQLSSYHDGGRGEEISLWSAELLWLTLGGILHVRFNLAEVLPLLSHKLLLASRCKATPDRNPHAEKFTLSQQEIEPFASTFTREKLKGKVTFRRGLLGPDFIESNIALVGERQALRALLAVAKACRDRTAKGHGQQCNSVRQQQKTHFLLKGCWLAFITKT